MKLLSTKDRELNYIRALVYGDSGVGKTTSLRTLPEKTTIIATAERGSLPLRNHDYAVLQFDSWADVRTLLEYFLHPDKIEDDATKAALDGKKTLAIDSLSELSDLCVRHIVQVDRRRLIRDRTDQKKDTPQGVYEEQMTMEDWGLYRTRMLNLISAFCHLPIHVVMTCLASWSKNKQGGDVYRTPNLSGKAALECPAYFDLVLHMEAVPQDTGESVRLWRTETDGEITAKDASGSLEQFEPADWTKLFQKVLGTSGKVAK